MKSYAVAVTCLFKGSCEIKFVRANSFTEALCAYADYEWVKDNCLLKKCSDESELECLKTILNDVDQYLDIKEIPDLIE